MKLTDDMLSQHAAEARDIWLSALPQKDDVPEHEFSGKFNRKMNRLIREQRRTPRMRRVTRYARRTAVFAPLLIAVIFSGLMTVDTYRTAVIDIVTKESQEYTELSPSTDVDAGDGTDIDTDDGARPGTDNSTDADTDGGTDTGMDGGTNSSGSDSGTDNGTGSGGSDTGTGGGSDTGSDDGTGNGGSDTGTGDGTDSGTDNGTDIPPDVSAPAAALFDISLGYLPDGMAEVESKRLQYDDYRYTYFEDADGRFFDLTEILIVSEEDAPPIPDTENAVVTHLNIMGQDAVLIEKDGENTIVWVYEQVCYTLHGNIASSELEMIARNIKLE